MEWNKGWWRAVMFRGGRVEDCQSFKKHRPRPLLCWCWCSSDQCQLKQWQFAPHMVFVWFCPRFTLTVNYDVKQIQFKKQLQYLALVTLNNLMTSLTVRLEDGYCSITVANHRLITVIKFIAKSYNHF